MSFVHWRQFSSSFAQGYCKTLVEGDRTNNLYVTAGTGLPPYRYTVVAALHIFVTSLWKSMTSLWNGQVSTAAEDKVAVTSSGCLADFPFPVVPSPASAKCAGRKRKWHITQPLRSPPVMVCSLFPCSSNSLSLLMFLKAPGLMLLTRLWASRSSWSPAGRVLGTDFRLLWLANK